MQQSLHQGGNFCSPRMPGFVLLVILVLVILLPFGRCLLDPPGVFIGITGIWTLPENLLLQISHSLEASAIGILCSLDHVGMHMLQLRSLVLLSEF